MRSDGKECTKNHDAREKRFVLLTKPLALFDVLVAAAVVISEFTQQDGSGTAAGRQNACV